MELVNELSIVSGTQGGDMSHYQIVNNWNSVATKLKFLYLKATEGSEQGSHYIDPKMDAYFKGAKSVGILSGFYHFCRFVNVVDAVQEADWFIKNIKGYDFDLPPCLDLEYYGCANDQVFKDATVAFLERVKDQLGSVIIYIPKMYYDIVKDVIAPYGIWLADPSSTINIDKTLAQLFAWQNNWHGAVPGVAGEVDLDIAGGSFFTTRNKIIHPTPAPAPTVPPKVEPAPAPVKSAPVQPAPSGKIIAQVRVITDALNIRSGAGTQFPVVKVAQKGEVYNVTGNNNDWHEVLIDDKGTKGYAYGNNGQYLELVVPAPAPAPSYTTYVVRAGDTLSAIAVAHGTTTAALQQLNGLADPNALQLGQTLKIPAHGAAAAAPKVVPATYVVQPGDSLSKIAAKVGVPQRTLEKLNDISNPDKIFAGQHLRLR